MNIALTKRKHVPMLKVDGVDWFFRFWEYKTAKYVENTGLHLDSIAASVVIRELPHGHYLPPFSLQGKKVLDIGACCGETAWYYLQQGAKKVTAIECDDKRLKFLRDNVNRLGLNVEIVAEPFKVSHLTDFNYDFIKCDVEGYEMILLDFKSKLKPCIAEIHTLWIKDQFEKAGFKTITPQQHTDLATVNTCMMSNCHKNPWLTNTPNYSPTTNNITIENPKDILNNYILEQ